MGKLHPIDTIGFIELVDKFETDSALKVVNSARISYNKSKEVFDSKDTKLCDFLWNNGHTSPYRHSFFTFHIKAPLFVFRQWVKYQVGSGWRKYEIGGDPVSAEVFDLFFDTDKGCSWNEISGRYVEIAPEFYVPEKMRTNPSHGNKQKSVDMHADFDHARERAEMLEDCKILYEKYMRRVQIGIAKEQARMLLPQNVYTQAYWTVSMQGVLHMLDQRLHPDAQWEIQQYAKCVQTALNEAVPNFSVLCKFAE